MDLVRTDPRVTMTATIGLEANAPPMLSRTNSSPYGASLGARGTAGGGRHAAMPVAMTAASRDPLALGEELRWPDGGDHADQEDGRYAHRNGDATKLALPAGAVDPRRFVQLVGDVLQAGDEDDHGVAELLPHRQKDDGKH